MPPPQFKRVVSPVLCRHAVLKKNCRRHRPVGARSQRLLDCSMHRFQKDEARAYWFQTFVGAGGLAGWPLPPCPSPETWSHHYHGGDDGVADTCGGWVFMTTGTERAAKLCAMCRFISSSSRRGPMQDILHPGLEGKVSRDILSKVEGCFTGSLGMSLYSMAAKQ
jgi:hypothetical protein